MSNTFHVVTQSVIPDLSTPVHANHSSAIPW